jgi:hypothetical protein
MAIGIAVVAVSSMLAGFSWSFAELLVLRGAGGQRGRPAAGAPAGSCSAGSPARRSAGWSRLVAAVIAAVAPGPAAPGDPAGSRQVAGDLTVLAGRSRQ